MFTHYYGIFPFYTFFGSTWSTSSLVESTKAELSHLKVGSTTSSAMLTDLSPSLGGGRTHRSGGESYLSIVIYFTEKYKDHGVGVARESRQRCSS